MQTLRKQTCDNSSAQGKTFLTLHTAMSEGAGGASSGDLSGPAASDGATEDVEPTLLGILGHDELLHIAGCLNQGDLKALAATCTRLLQLAYDPRVPGKPWSFVDMDFWPFTRIRMKPKDEMELMVANSRVARFLQKQAEQSEVTVCCGVPASNPAQADLERSGRAAVSVEDIQRALRHVTDHLIVFRCHMMATDEHFRPLAACHKLKVLCLETTCSESQSSVTDVGLTHLTSLESLEQLHMTGFKNMTIRGLRPLLGHGLRVLDLAKLSSQHLTVQQVLRALSEMCPHLEELDLRGFYRRGADSSQLSWHPLATACGD